MITIRDQIRYLINTKGTGGTGKDPGGDKDKPKPLNLPIGKLKNFNKADKSQNINRPVICSYEEWMD